MPEYAMEDSYSVGSSGSISAAKADISPRIEQVKVLDDALSRLEMHVEKLAHRIAPALRPSTPEAVGIDKSPDSNDSDIVAHLRHTIRRVNDVSENLAAFTHRIDL